MHEKLLIELRTARTKYHEVHGVPINWEYARFLDAIGKMEDALREASQHPVPAPHTSEFNKKMAEILESVKPTCWNCGVKLDGEPPKYDPSWHGSQAHTFVTDKPVGSEVKSGTGDKS